MIKQSGPKFITPPLKYLDKVFASGWLGSGPLTEKFEERIKNYTGCKEFISTNCATSAIFLSLEAAGVGPGDEVVVPSFTFIATIQPILWLGAIPVFADIELEDLNTSLKELKKCVTDKTKAFILVHYASNPVKDLTKIVKFAEKHNIAIIEDAAHCIGSFYNQKHVGCESKFACLSFSPHKAITTGVGGGIMTNDFKLAQLLRVKRTLGIDKDVWNRQKESDISYKVIQKGYRCEMNDVAAAIGLAQLDDVETLLRIRKKIVDEYDMKFEKTKIFSKISRKVSAPYLYVCLLKEGISRDEIINFYKKHSIEVGIHYRPNHMQPLFRYFKKLKNTEAIADRVISLPLHAGLSVLDVKKVVAITKELDKKYE